MVSQQGFEDNTKLYRFSVDELCDKHGRMPTVYETALYMSLMTNEDVEKILDLIKLIEENKDNQ